MKISLTRLTTIFAVAILTVSSSPPNIGRGNYVYDENSIPENEKILKLFVRLAAHTANRLINLKIKKNQLNQILKIYEDEMNVESDKFSESYRDKIIQPVSVISDEQARRSIIREPSNDESEKVGGYSWVMINESERQSGTENYHPKDSDVSFLKEENSKNFAKDVTYDENNPVSLLLEEQQTKSKNDKMVIDKSNEEFPDDKESRSHSDDEMSDREVSEARPTARTVISDVESDRVEEKLKYNDDERTERSDLLESITESSMVNDFTSYVTVEEPKLNSDSMINLVEISTEESTEAVKSRKLNPENDFERKIVVTEEEPNENDDLELENRALFNLERNNYVTHYVDKSMNINRADTTVMNGGSGEPGRVVINQNAGSKPIERLEMGKLEILNGGNELLTGKSDGLGKELSTGDVVVNQIAGSTGFGKTIEMGESTNENHATAKVGKFEKSLGIGIGVGVGLNRGSMGIKNFADEEQMSISDSAFGLTSDIKKIKESNGVGTELHKKLALQVQPKHSSNSELIGGILGTESNEKYSANMDSGNSMQGLIKLNEKNSGIFHGSLAEESQTNMNSGNTMQDSTMFKENHASNYGSFYGVGSQMKGSANMNLKNSIQGSTKIGNENFGMHQNELNSHMAHDFVSKNHESVEKKEEQEMHSLASAREAHHHSSTSQGNLIKSVHSVSESLSGEAEKGENKVRQYKNVMMNQESGLNLGAQIGVDMQHETSLNYSGDEKSRVVGKDIYGLMHGENNFKGIRGGMKVEAGKELSSSGFGILNGKTNLLHKVLNPVGKFNGKFNLVGQVLTSS